MKRKGIKGEEKNAMEKGSNRMKESEVENKFTSEWFFR
jgi:hypothetical protein